jgi:hypothetical protein
MNALSQVSASIGHALSGQDVVLIVAFCLILFAALVVFPAVWSSKPSRRRAALAVLDRIIRWRS